MERERGRERETDCKEEDNHFLIKTRRGEGKEKHLNKHKLG